AKGDRTFKGVYQFMYHQFAQIMPAKYAAFNFEQDLGIESLRRSKAAYRPERMLKKYRVARR
ncbi:MAG: phosphatidylglycerol lysyltransferase domain-containing protein, partial [Chitinivibrionales bacterium]|nr:phosphatidylglycerol lysyltransferase domain-containing protein [Chitinivibrionales bacterium]